MKKNFYAALYLVLIIAPCRKGWSQTGARTVARFDTGWKFNLGDAAGAAQAVFNDAGWRALTLPHDWSIEGPFDKNSPAGIGGGALTGGIGWYRKTFVLPGVQGNKHVFIDFDGVYRNSEVWINGHLLGKRPNGYISFRYELTPFLVFGGKKNVIAVKVDNSKQPNSRWYSGSGIYRHVWLVTTRDVMVDQWGVCVTTPVVSAQSATVRVSTQISSLAASADIELTTTIYDKTGNRIGMHTEKAAVSAKTPVAQQFTLDNPHLWSVNDPYLYKAVAVIRRKGQVLDEYTTPFGIRFFTFDVDKGFLLNGGRVKINGVCNHHDLGCLGTAVNTRALERQLEILKAMGCNGIRTSHNPPAPELLDLCDKMGFIVMDEAFDMWKKEKNPYDYHLDWDEWHERDLKDQVLRDRNHPSVFVWSIGNEVNEQWDTTDVSGTQIARELTGIVHALDPTRPVTSALSSPYPFNPVVKANALDLIGYNYDNRDLADFHTRFPGKKFIGTESVSALETRGFYDRSVPSDSIRRWPQQWDKPLAGGNTDHTVSAYDHVSAPWGGTHEETWKLFKKYDFLSGQYIWTGFDYIGEPTPYEWPSRSSYFGIIDLAGFPKDVYYMYQSEWTDKPVLHLVPDHWSWKKGDSIDVWAYYNNADEVELYLNGQSLGIRKKQNDDMHVEWKNVAFESGTLKAVSRKGGKTVLTSTINTAVAPQKIVLKADRVHIKADGRDLSFITVKITDKAGSFFPSDDLVKFTVTGPGIIAGVDNGSQTSMEPFKASRRKAFNGLCLAVIQSAGKKGVIHVKAVAEGMEGAAVDIVAE